MIIKITQFSEPHLWYHDKIGQTFEATKGQHYYSLTISGFERRVHFDDAIEVENIDKRRSEMEQKVRDIAHWNNDAIQFRERFLDELEQLMRSFPDYRELKSDKATAYSYWVAHIKSALGDDSYRNPIATTILSTIKGLLEDIDVDYPADVDITDFNWDVEKVIKELTTE